MREILFRGKRVSDGVWEEGFLVPITVNCYDKGYELIGTEGIEYDELDYYNPSFETDRVIPETVGQYTGLTDRNGKRIFEGDIVSIIIGDVLKVGAVFYSEEAARVGIVDGNNEKNFSFMQKPLIKQYSVFVVGNIHDNPELLEVTQ